MQKVADKEELLKVYDENHNFTGKYEKRSIVHEKQLFHDEVALWIINSKKEVLLQKRSPNKKINPNKYALCAGHVGGGQSICDALKVEAKEEIGINIDNYDVEFLVIIKRTEPHNYCFSHHFYIKADITIEQFVIQEEELSEVVYMDYNKLKQMVKNNDPQVVFKWNSVYKQIFSLLDNIIN